MVEVAHAVREFVVLPLVVPPNPSLQNDGLVQHYLYLRPHSPKVPSPDTPRSLFVTNVPIDATLAHFRHLFGGQLDAGRVERVDFDSRDGVLGHGASSESSVEIAKGSSKGKKRKLHENTAQGLPTLPDTWDRHLHRSGSTAVVVFVDRISMERAFKRSKKTASRTAENLIWGEAIAAEQLPDLGLKRYRVHHQLQYPSPLKLQSTVDQFMSGFAAREAATAATRTRQRSMPDADGFITVTRGGRVGPGRADEAREKLEKLKEKEDKKRQEMEASGFYRFQAREAKKKEAHQLMDKFQTDRRLIEEMTRRRKRQKPD